MKSFIVILVLASVSLIARAEPPKPTESVTCTTQKNCIRRATKCIGGDVGGDAIVRFAATVTCVNASLQQTSYESEVVENIEGMNNWPYQACFRQLNAIIAAWDQCQ
jgi:hypothetical protein